MHCFVSGLNSLNLATLISHLVQRTESRLGTSQKETYPTSRTARPTSLWEKPKFTTMLPSTYPRMGHFSSLWSLRIYPLASWLACTASIPPQKAACLPLLASKIRPSASHFRRPQDISWLGWRNVTEPDGCLCLWRTEPSWLRFTRSKCRGKVQPREVKINNQLEAVWYIDVTSIKTTSIRWLLIFLWIAYVGFLSPGKDWFMPRTQDYWKFCDDDDDRFRTIVSKAHLNFIIEYQFTCIIIL